MGSGSKKTIGAVLAFGFILQILCVSVYSLTGNCPVKMSYSENQEKKENLPPCHKTQNSSKEKESSSNECCPKDKSVASVDLTKILDWERILLQKVFLSLLITEFSSPEIVSENVILNSSYIILPSDQSFSLSTLQVFLI
ncbi:hypothetical protein [Leptospira sarikeiensis]|uniref:Uncharacterized protein n=1 Tax=Leptospira sarikeiensis TaxID=2484943 RepID=A0A4R9K189_9LEPT|nr:hypothetical protein [Leptospira sarikeiensis]TGL59452.1 hypothetical protein EHQ64_15265 [Leptospira sarikeiensis]